MPIVYNNFIDNPPNFGELFDELNTCGLFEDMCIVSKEKPILSRKTGSFLGIPDSNGGMPYLTCPSFFESYPMPDFVKNLLIGKMKEKFDFNCNSIKIQHYILGKCGINPHSDKLLDLNPGKSMFIYRINS